MMEEKGSFYVLHIYLFIRHGNSFFGHPLLLLPPTVKFCLFVYVSSKLRKAFWQASLNETGLAYYSFLDE